MTSSCTVSPRGNSPVIKHTKRGRIDLAMEDALTVESMHQVRKTLVQDAHAKNYKVARESVRNSYKLLHSSSFGTRVPDLLMTIAKVKAIGAMPRQELYMSTQAHCYNSKDAHITKGGSGPQERQGAVTKSPDLSPAE